VMADIVAGDAAHRSEYNVAISHHSNQTIVFTDWQSANVVRSHPRP
jgi:hypothetical protein